jgi:hypothetical protein
VRTRRPLEGAETRPVAGGGRGRGGKGGELAAPRGGGRRREETAGGSRVDRSGGTRRSVRAELRPRFGRSGARWALPGGFVFTTSTWNSCGCRELGDVVFFFGRILSWYLFMEKSQ